MSRADKVLAKVAAGMQDSEKVYETLTHAAWLERREADRESILSDVADAISSYSFNTDEHYQTAIAHRLMMRLQGYARAALTEAAESDIEQDDEESGE